MSTPKINTPHKASCHCGAVKYEVTLADGLADAKRCTCSMCRMRGAVAVGIPLEALKITGGEDKLTLYQFNTKQAKHYFCSVCGIYTFHQRRSRPDQFSINVACLEGISPFDIEEVPVGDGVNHPNDTGVTRWLGVLRFERNEVAR